MARMARLSGEWPWPIARCYFLLSSYLNSRRVTPASAGPAMPKPEQAVRQRKVLGTTRDTAR